MKKLLCTMLAAGLLLSVVTDFGYAASKKKKKNKKDAYQFKVVKRVKDTPVKSQDRTGTCWCFATISLLEAEAIKAGKGEVDLSEMFVVRHAYTDKAINYVRLHGGANFSQGGQGHDVIKQIKKHGLVPEKTYPGIVPGYKKHNHSELAKAAKGFLDGAVKRNRHLSKAWLPAFHGIMNAYLGTPVEKFEYKGKEYTPKSFVSEGLGLDMNNYVEITSYTHHPFYETFRLEIPDNWDFDDNYHNIPMDEMVKLVDHAIEQGYTFCWDADVSERYFSKNRMDVSLVPEKDYEDLSREERNKAITKPVKEKVVTQEMRQVTFDNFKTTDDHLMHIVGIAKDKKGGKFYIMKNSWGTDRKYEGYFYVSEAFFRLKTINILINKNAIPEDLRKKMKL